MIKKLFSRLGKSDRSSGLEQEENGQKQAKKKLKYNEQLIPDLKDAHGALFDTYLEIEAAFKEDNEMWHTIKDLIQEFESSLKLHVMLENRQLYTYLEELYEDEHDTEHLEHLKALQQNMGDILKEVKFFSKKYSDWENYKRNKDVFLSDLGTVGKVLTKRVEMEEKFIYPMYMEGH